MAADDLKTGLENRPLPTNSSPMMAVVRTDALLEPAVRGYQELATALENGKTLAQAGLAVGNGFKNLRRQNEVMAGICFGSGALLIQ